MHIEQHTADPFMLEHMRVCAHQGKHSVSELGSGGPDFLAVDLEEITPIHSPGLQTCQI
jgi:hypothetical protein